ncbi:hypothetical protein H0H87_005497 [Tephrocybe sp. NHM501043]|nr:hypothetical protein H0H87_005497 [Tephrocybe sp. NHM501043]
MLLTVGSPTLAAYSLTLTVLNGRWIARRFSSYTFPNTREAVRILSSLQQSPLQINTRHSLLASLIVLPSNDEWWRELVEWLDYTHSWSISAVTSIAWVIIAYIFTVIDSFIGDITVSINANGQGVGSLWIWLLPIVIGWLQISPKCSTTRLYQAMKRANNIAYVATPFGTQVLASSSSGEYASSSSGEHANSSSGEHANSSSGQYASSSSGQHAISLRQGVEDPLYDDENCTIPIYNYARFLPWVQAVEDVSDAFRAASGRARRRIPVNPDVIWQKGERYPNNLHPENRIGTRHQVEEYCLPFEESPSPYHRTGWGPNVFSRIMLASFMALLLQWGLGCRSGSYLLYGSVSTAVWMLLLISSFLTHYVSTTPHLSLKTTLARRLALLLRRLGKVLAALNAAWIVVTCLFQFSNFFDRCYCNSSVLGRGVKSWDVIAFGPEDVTNMKAAWIGGVALAAGSAACVVFFVNLFIDPQMPESSA